MGGHEAVGQVVAVGEGVDPALIGQLRGVGWFAGSCGHCDECLAGRAGRFDLIINTVNQPLNWGVVIGALARRGRLHLLGAVLEPLSVNAFDLIMTRRLITGSPTSSPASLRKMVAFCARHGIQPLVERLPMAEINTAVDRLRRGDVRYRFVLDGPA